MKPNGSAWRHGRARLDLTAEQAAQRLFISHRYLWNIESNQPSATPGIRLVYRAAELYGCSFDDLVAKDEDDETSPVEEPERADRQPDPTAPPSRPDRDRKGPPRAEGLAAAS